jgi:hypothetical protein
MPKITVTINGAVEVLSDNLNKSISEQKGYKYTYMKQLVSRVRLVKSNVSELPENVQNLIISNTLIAERNIASFAAEQYAMLNQDELFNAFAEVVEDIEKLFTEQ